MNEKIKNDLLELLKKIVNIDTCFPPGKSKVFSKFVYTISFQKINLNDVEKLFLKL